MLSMPNDIAGQYNNILQQRAIPEVFRAHYRKWLPQMIMPELKRQLEAVCSLYDKDIESGYSGVFLFDSLEKKYPSAAKDFIWQWFFPIRQCWGMPT
jgi:hypothetical protein